VGREEVDALLDWRRGVGSLEEGRIESREGKNGVEARGDGEEGEEEEVEG
jgi:hypothetical protein